MNIISHYLFKVYLLFYKTCVLFEPNSILFFMCFTVVFISVYFQILKTNSDIKLIFKKDICPKQNICFQKTTII